MADFDIIASDDASAAFQRIIEAATKAAVREKVGIVKRIVQAARLSSRQSDTGHTDRS